MSGDRKRDGETEWKREGEEREREKEKGACDTNGFDREKTIGRVSCNDNLDMRYLRLLARFSNLTECTASTLACSMIIRATFKALRRTIIYLQDEI